MRENSDAMYFEELRATEQVLAFDYLEGKMKEQMGISALTSDVLRDGEDGLDDVAWLAD